MSESQKPTANNSIKPVSVVEHGNYLYGTLDGLDFVASGIMQDCSAVRAKNISRASCRKEARYSV